MMFDGFRLRVALLAASVVLSTSMQSAVAGPDGPVTWTSTVTLGGGWGRMVRLANGHWLAVTTRYPADTNSFLRISRSINNARSWVTLSEVKEEGRTLDNGELILLPNGTVLLTMRSLVPNVSYRLPVYASSDSGVTWTYRSNIDASEGATGAAGRGLWEPDFWVLGDGRLIVTYSNERHTGYSQLISERISNDNGVTWEPEFWAVAQPGGGNLRPGMSQITRMANGEYLLVYEVVNLGRADVHCKISPDGVTWPTGIGTRIPSQHCGPFVTSLTNGLVLVSSCENEVSFSEDFGRTWQKIEPPGWNLGYYFSWPALYQTATNEIALMVVTNGTRIRFGTVSPRPEWSNPFTENFNDGSDDGWARYGGNFALTGGRYVLSNEGTNGKAMTGDSFWTDGTLEADVRITSPGNAGLLFRTTNPDYEGPDHASGYYVGLDTAGLVLLGRMSDSWTLLTNRAMAVTVDTTYRLKVTMDGGLISVFVDDMNTPKFMRTDTQFARGQIGVRAFQCDAEFDNLIFSNAVPLRLEAIPSPAGVNVRWPRTASTVKLVGAPTLLSPPQLVTNSPSLVSNWWNVTVPASGENGRFLWLRAE